MHREKERPQGMTGLQACVMITVAVLLPTQCEQGAVSVALWYEVCASKPRAGVAGADGPGSSLLTELTETGRKRP